NRKEGKAGVRFQLVSDLHLEFPGCLDKLPHIPVNAPILCLLGDIGYPNKANYRAYLLEQADRFEHVLVVAGNHEYYNQESVQHADRLISNDHSLAAHPLTIPCLHHDAQQDEICAERDNLHYLNKRSVRVGDVLFLGCTLWPYIPPEAIEKVWMRCNDYKIVVEGKALEHETTSGGLMSLMSLVYKNVTEAVKSGPPPAKSEDDARKNEGENAEAGAAEKEYHQLTPHETNLWHEQHVDWLVQEIERVKEANERTAGVDGEKVKFRCIHPEAAGIEEICYDDLEWMMEDPVEPQDQQQLVGEEEEVEEELNTNKEAGVRFQLVSDLHLEFPGCLDKLPHIPVNAPILCLLGDIGYPNKANYRAYLLSRPTAGNHEYYNQESVQHADRLIDEICAERDNLHYLNKRSVRVGDVLFLGCTLWPYIPPESISKVWTMCNDYRRIVAEGKAIEPSPSAAGNDGGIVSHMMSLVYKKNRARPEAKERRRSAKERRRGGTGEASAHAPTKRTLWHEQHVDWL
ncbi:uncharacterized protein ACA1_346250, partial [Acanthamoeba castellanii str. Neff]